MDQKGAPLLEALAALDRRFRDCVHHQGRAGATRTPPDGTRPEMIAPAPPGVPRLVPGRRITAAPVTWLLAERNAGAFILDPVDPSGRRRQVVAV